MKLRDKSASATFYVTDVQTGMVVEVDPLEYLTPLQAEEMSTRPDMILQFSHYLADVWGQQGVAKVEVHAWVQASLNGRIPQLLIDPYVDLAAEPRSLLPAAWILPLED
jgi:hypothetical protein